jgi:beta-lactamase regulating signal transducer with metallopeptidase domain
MNGWIEWFNATSDVWFDRFWRATWQGAIVIVVAFVLTTLLYRLSPRVRSWIWRLAYVKLLLLLLWTTPIELALLPSEGRGARDEGREVGVAGVGNQKSGIGDGEKASIPASETAVAGAESAKGVEPSDAVSTAPLAEPSEQGRTQQAESRSFSPVAHGELPTAGFGWQSYLLAAWLLGLAAVIAWLAADMLRAGKLLRNSRPLEDEHWQKLSDDVCRRLGLRRAIRLRNSATAHSPMLVRFLRPAIILPQSMVDSAFPSPSTGEGRGEGDCISQNHIALAIAHEAAHLRRHDLAWNLLAAVVHVAMYFHPLVWLAHRRIRLEQEMACDELVLEKLSAAPQDYGRMLVNVVRRLAAV